ncbi:MAG TPA: prepilin-type N-terminal cleavage/methylation domain-containing protein [Oscillatoriaceae cyanobacterium]
MSRRSGFTLVEVSLAIAVGLVLMAAGIYAYQGMQQSARFSQAREMVGTMQTNIGMEKFRLGSPPPLSEVQSNTDSTGKQFWSGTAAGSLPADPVMNQATIATFDSTASPVPLKSGDPQNEWDNPHMGSPAPVGQGGWLYDPNTGAFRINLSNRDYPDQRPGTW